MSTCDLCLFEEVRTQLSQLMSSHGMASCEKQKFTMWLAWMNMARKLPGQRSLCRRCVHLSTFVIICRNMSLCLNSSRFVVSFAFICITSSNAFSQAGQDKTPQELVDGIATEFKDRDIETMTQHIPSRLYSNLAATQSAKQVTGNSCNSASTSQSSCAAKYHEIT